MCRRTAVLSALIEEKAVQANKGAFYHHVRAHAAGLSAVRLPSCGRVFSVNCRISGL